MSGSVHEWVSAALARLARGAGVRVFPIVCPDAPSAAHDVRLADDLVLLDSPRSAHVLLVAGSLPEMLHEAVARVHDQMAHPRGVVWWTDQRASARDTLPFPDALIIDASGPVWSALRRLQQDLVAGRRASSPPILPDIDPAPWRGVGPYGQGGTGMTGGVPYGRPLADRAEDRDGLMLDQLPVRVGPFFPPFPPGLVLDVKLQGDVIQQVSVAANAFADVVRAADAAGDPFVLALSRRVAIGTVELARAEHHLRWLAHALRVHGLPALGHRTLRIAAMLAREGATPGITSAVASLARLLERTRALRWATAGVGVTARDLLSGRGLGPVARAAGVVEDARAVEPAYRALGFEPIVQRDGGGDAHARWTQRLAEVAQSLDLVARGGGLEAWGAGVVEAPRGRLATTAGPSERLRSLLPDLLCALEWGDAVTTVVSLDLGIADAGVGAAAELAA